MFTWEGTLKGPKDTMWEGTRITVVLLLSSAKACLQVIWQNIFLKKMLNDFDLHFVNPVAVFTLKLLTFPHKFKTLSNKIRGENTDTHLTLI